MQISTSSRSAPVAIALAFVLFAASLVLAAPAEAQIDPIASVTATCVNDGGVIEFELTGGTGGTEFTYRVSGLDDRSESVPEGQTITRRRSGRRGGVAYAASVLADGVMVASESLRINCGAPPAVTTTVTGLCVERDGRIRVELVNDTTAAPLSYEIGLVGAEVPPFVGVINPGASATHTRSGRTDRVHEVVVTIGETSSTWPIEIACDDPPQLGAIIESYCEDSGGVIVFRLRTGTQPADFVVSVSGLDDRVVTVAPFDVATTVRTGRRDGSYSTSVRVGSQVLAAAQVAVDCEPEPATSVEVSTDCADGGGRIAITVTNDGEVPVSFTAIVRGVQAPPLTGQVEPGSQQTVYRTGRRDGDALVDVTIDGGPGQTFEATVDCVADPTLTAEISLECVNGEGSIIIDLAAGATPQTGTVSVSGLDDRVVDVAAGASKRVFRSGRPDGTYQVVVRSAGAVVADQTVVVDCDGKVDDVGFFVDVTCEAGGGVFTIILRNTGPVAFDFSVTTARAQVPPFVGTLEVDEVEMFRRTGRRDGFHTVIATIGGVERLLPVVVSCDGDDPEATPTPTAVAPTPAPPAATPTVVAPTPAPPTPAPPTPTPTPTATPPDGAPLTLAAELQIPSEFQAGQSAALSLLISDIPERTTPELRIDWGDGTVDAASPDAIAAQDALGASIGLLASGDYIHHWSQPGSYTVSISARAGDSSATTTRTVTVGGPACTIIGSDVAETLIGTPDDDVICGLGGDDILDGGEGDDLLIGGAGNDDLIGGPDNDTLLGDEGDDNLQGGPGNDDLLGGGGDDVLDGGEGDDTLVGGNGTDAVDGGPGIDSCRADDGCEEPLPAGVFPPEVEVTTVTNNDSVDLAPAGFGTGGVVIGGQVDEGIAAVEVIVRGQRIPVSLETDEAGQTVFEWELTTKTSGSYDVMIVTTSVEGETSTETVTLDITAPTDDDTLVAPDVLVIDDTLRATLVSYDPGTGDLIFAGDLTDTIPTGTVVIAEPTDLSDPGILRRVLTVVFEGGQTVATTEHANITDVFRQLSFEAATPGDDPLVAERRQAGREPKPEVDDAADATFKKGFVEGEIAFDIGVSTDVMLIANMDLGWTCRAYVVCTPSVDEFVSTATASLIASAGVTASAEATWEPDGLDGRDIPLPTIRFAVFGIPVWFSNSIEIEPVLEVTARGEASVEAFYELGFTTGFEYRNGTGDAYFEPFNDGGIQWSAQAEITATAGIEIELESLLYSIAGPSFSITPSLVGTLTLLDIDSQSCGSDPFEPSLAFEMPVDLEVEIENPVTGSEVYEEEFNLGTFSYELYPTPGEPRFESGPLLIGEGEPLQGPCSLNELIALRIIETAGPSSMGRLGADELAELAEVAANECSTKADIWAGTQLPDPAEDWTEDDGWALHPCLTGPVFYSGGGLQAPVTEHIADAQNLRTGTPEWIQLTYEERSSDRSRWYYKASPGTVCGRSAPEGESCDEYPFWSTTDGYRSGRSPIPSVRLLNGRSNSSHGGSYGKFTADCPEVKGVAGLPAPFLVIPLPTEGPDAVDRTSFWTCAGGDAPSPGLGGNALPGLIGVDSAGTILQLDDGAITTLSTAAPAGRIEDVVAEDGTAYLTSVSAYRGHDAGRIWRWNGEQFTQQHRFAFDNADVTDISLVFADRPYAVLGIEDDDGFGSTTIMGHYPDGWFFEWSTDQGVEPTDVEPFDGTAGLVGDTIVFTGDTTHLFNTAVTGADEDSPLTSGGLSVSDIVAIAETNDLLWVLQDDGSFGSTAGSGFAIDDASIADVGVDLSSRRDDVVALVERGGASVLRNLPGAAGDLDLDLTLDTVATQVEITRSTIFVGTANGVGIVDVETGEVTPLTAPGVGRIVELEAVSDNISVSFDLDTTVETDPSPLVPGAPGSMTFTTTNSGVLLAPEVVVRFRLPAGLENVVWPDNCTLEVIDDETTDSVCDLGDIEPGGFTQTVIFFDVSLDYDPNSSVRIRHGVNGTVAPFTDGVAGSVSVSNPAPFPCRTICDKSDSWGDPHLVTFDRIGYDLQTVGEFVYARSDDGEIEVQARHAPFRNSTSVSINAAVAAELNGKNVHVAIGNVVRVDGEIVEVESGTPFQLGNGAAIYRNGSTWNLAWPGEGELRPRLEAKVRSSHMNVSLYIPPRFNGRMTGLLGNADGDPDNDFAFPDGTPIGQPVSSSLLYGPFADSWRVTDDTSLLWYDEGQTTETFTDRSFPSRILTVDDLDPVERARAELLCRGAGISNPILIDACVLDLVTTGGTDFLVGGLGVLEPASASEGVYRATFEEGLAPGFETTVVSTVEGRRYVGPLAADTNTLTLTDLPPHHALSLSYDLYIFGEWDGEGAAQEELDRFAVSVQGGEVLASHAYSLGAETQSYPSPGSPANSGAVETDTVGTPSAVYRFTHMIDHWQQDIAIDFTATGLDVVEGETWGLDNVEVIADLLVPESVPYIFEETLTSEVTAPRGQTLHTFYVPVDGRVKFDWLECFPSMRAELRDGAGELLAGLSSCRDAYFELSEGAHVLSVQSSGASIGTYAFEIMPSDVVPREYSGVVESATPLSYHRFEVTDPTVDSTGNGNTATFAASDEDGERLVELDVPGALGSEPLSTGAGGVATGEVTATIAGAPQGASPRTLEFWAQIDSTGNDWLAQVGDQFGLYYNTNIRFSSDPGKFRVHYGSGYRTVSRPDGVTLDDGAWHHYVVTWDGTELRFFIDGALALATSAVSPDVTGDLLSVGGHDGAYDEVAVYDRALQPQEIAEHHAVGRSTEGVSCLDVPAIGYSGIVASDNPVLYLRLNEATDAGSSDRLALDSSTSCSPGTLAPNAQAIPGALTGTSDGAVSAASGTVAWAGGPGVLPEADLPRSLEVWAQFNETDNDWLMRYGTTFGLLYNTDIRFSSDPGRFRVYWAANQYVSINRPPGMQLVDGEWHHYVVTYEAGELVLYIDGFRAGSAQLDAPLATTATAPFIVGGQPGSFDEAALYDTALTAEQVASHFSAGRSLDVVECRPGGTDAYATAVRDDAPITYLRLDEAGSERVAFDSSGRCSNGSIAVGATTATSALAAGVGSAAEGVNGSAVALHSGFDLPTGDEPRTVEGWFRSASTSSNDYLFRYGSQFGLLYNTNIRFSSDPGQFRVYYGGAYVSIPRPAGMVFTDEQWHHYAITYSDDVLSLYIDGVLAGARDVGALTTTLPSGVIVGGQPGAYDEIALYGTALDATTIARHWAIGASAAGAACPAAPTDPYGRAVAALEPSLQLRLGDSTRLVAGERVALDSSANCTPGSFDVDAVEAPSGVPATTDAAVSVPIDNAAVRAPAALLPGGNTARSIEFWATASEGNNDWLAVYGNQFGLYYNTDIRFSSDPGQFRVYYGGGNYVSIARPAGMEFLDGQWHHFVLTYGADVVSLYMDSALIGQRTVGPIDTDLSQEASLQVGAFGGSWDEVAVYPVALTSEQVSNQWAIGNDSAGEPCTTEPADPYGSAVFDDLPQVYLRLGDLGDPTLRRVAHDSSPNCFSGSMTTEATAAPGGAIESTTDGAALAPNVPVAYSGGATELPSGDGARSIEVWRRGSESTNNWIMNSGTQFGLYYNTDIRFSNDRDQFRVYWAAGEYVSVPRPPGMLFTDDVWHHYVVTYELGELSLWIDGYLAGRRTLAEPLATVADRAFVVGGQPGTYDEAALYDRVLTNDEIQEHWSIGRSPDGADCSAPPEDPYAEAVLADAPLTLLRLDPTIDDRIAFDATSNCRNGALDPGGVAVETFDGAGSAVSGDVVGLVTPDGLPLGNEPRSIELWMQTNTSTNDWLLRYGTEFGLYYNTDIRFSNDRGRFRVYAAAGTYRSFPAAPDTLIADGNWHHYVATWDGAELAFYMDGLLIDRQPLDPIDTTVSPGLHIGGQPGAYDAVAIYDTALTAAQVAAHFAVR